MRQTIPLGGIDPTMLGLHVKASGRYRLKYRVSGVLPYRDYAKLKSNGSTRREKVSDWQYNMRDFF